MVAPRLEMESRYPDFKPIIDTHTHTHTRTDIIKHFRNFKGSYGIGTKKSQNQTHEVK